MATATQVVPSTSSAPSPSPTRPPSDCQILRACFPTVPFPRSTFPLPDQETYDRLGCCNVSTLTRTGNGIDVQCNVDGRITELALNAVGLTGRLDGRIARLTELTDLDLRNNLIEGDVPEAFRFLRGLKTLLLRNNTMDFILPTFVSEWTQLEILDIANAGVYGALPFELGTLTNLRELKAQRNAISGSIPPVLGNLLMLEILGLGYNQLRGSVPAQLGQLSHLKILDLSYNILNGSLPDGLLLLPNLTQLTLTNNEFSGRLPDIIANSSLQFMQLSNNNFSGPLPSSIGNAADLSYAYIMNNNFSGEIPSSFGRLGGLMRWDASNNSFSGNLPNAMGELTLLETILFNNNAINGSLPSTLGRLANLTVLLMSGNRLQTGLNNMVGLNNLAYLDLSRNQLIERFPDLQLFPKLSLVDISGNCIAFEQVKGNPDFKVEPQFYNCSGLADRIDPTASVNGSGVFGDLGASEKTSMPPALIAGIAIVALIATALFILAAVVAARASNKKLARAAAAAEAHGVDTLERKPTFFIRSEHGEIRGLDENSVSEVSRGSSPGSNVHLASPNRHSFTPSLHHPVPIFNIGTMRKLTMESSSSSNDCSTDPPISTVTTGVEVGVISAYDIVEEDRRSPSPVLSMRKFDFKQLPPTEVGVDMLLNRDPVVTPIITDATEGMEFRAPIGSTDFIDLFSSGFLTSTGPTVEPPLVNLDHDIKEKPHDWDPNAPLPPQRGTSFRPLIQLPTTYSNTYSVHPQPPSTRPISDSGIAPPLTPPLSAGNEKTVSTRSEAVHSRTSTFAAAGGQYLRFRDHPWTWTVRQVAEYLVRLGHPTPLVKTFIDNHIDGRAFLHLTDRDMNEELGIKSHDLRRSIIHSIHLLRISESVPQEDGSRQHIVNTSASSSNPRTESSLAVNNNHTESDAEARIVVTPPMPESVVRTVRMSGTEMVLPPAAEGGVVMPRLFAQDTLSVGSAEPPQYRGSSFERGASFERHSNQA